VADRFNLKAITRLAEIAATQSHAKTPQARERAAAQSKKKMEALRFAVRLAIEAEINRTDYAPAVATRVIDIQTDTVMDALLVWAGALYVSPIVAPLNHAPGRPRNSETRGPKPAKRRRGHPYAALPRMVGHTFKQQWTQHFPDYGRGRGARRRAELRDEAMRAFLALIGIVFTQPRDLLG
jgi:hypothetical protein